MFLYITKTFRTPAPLDQVFEFHGSPPAWALEAGQLVHRMAQNEFESVDLDTQFPYAHATGVTCNARKAKDVIDWLILCLRAHLSRL